MGAHGATPSARGLVLKRSTVLGALTLSIVSLAQTSGAPLSEEHRLWLKEEVPYIITDEERELFLSLGSFQERERAIEAFWDHRDSDRLTARNEFREEHYRRLAYADAHFGENGALTERGRFYVLLGEPDSIERIAGSNEIVDCEIWLYAGVNLPDVPQRFNLLFFKENNLGDYRLYRPLDDGPEDLLQLGVWFREDPGAALDQLKLVSMSLARATLTVDLTDPVLGSLAPPRLIPEQNPSGPRSPPPRPSPGAELAIIQILEAAAANVDTGYVEGFRRHGDRVSSEYSFRFVSNRAYWTTLYSPAGTPFVHYSLELDPSGVALRPSEDGTSFVARFEVQLEVRSRAGEPVFVQTLQPEIQVGSGDLERVTSLPVSYRHRFPLAPGHYQVSLLLENVETHHYTVREWNVSVPAGGEPGLGGVALAHRVQTAAPGWSFQLGGLEISTPADARFGRQDTLYAVAQIESPGPEDLLFVTLLGDRGVQQRHEVRAGEAREGAVVQPLSLADVEPGAYTVLFDFADGNGNVVASRSKSAEIVEGSVVRPGLVYREPGGAVPDELASIWIADQYLAQRRLDAAEKELHKVVASGDPRFDMARWKLASVLLFSARASEALELLVPIEDRYPDEIEVVEGLGFAYYLEKNHAEALPRFEQAMAMRPPDASLLNATGDCYERLGHPEKAREMFELSLGLDPDQPGVRARLEELP